MKIGIQTWGSNGDVRPMLALASGLRRAGHSVDLVVTSLDNRSYAHDCRSLDIGYHQIPKRVELNLEAFARKTFRMHALQWLKALLAEGFFPYEGMLYEAARELVASHDLVIGHHFLFPLKLAARQAGKPHVSVTLCHGAVPSRRAPPFRCPDLGSWLNRLQWRLFNALFDAYLKRDLGRLWREQGQPIPSCLFDDLLTSDQLDLVAVDPVFCPEAGDLPSPHRVCGFLNLEDDMQAWEMPPEWMSFLDEGEPPVYFSFGSLQQAVPEWAMDLFLDAVRRVNCRAMIQTSSSRFPPGRREGDCLFVGRHPHQPVFERCISVVHHGGAGTTHAATRAGCPSVIVPFMDEQVFWGRQIQRLGLGVSPLPAKRATGREMAKRLNIILTSPGFRQRAGRCRERMLNTDGVAAAVAALAPFGVLPS